MPKKKRRTQTAAARRSRDPRTQPDFLSWLQDRRETDPRILEHTRVVWPTIERLLTGRSSGVLTAEDVVLVFDDVILEVPEAPVATVHQQVGIPLMLYVEYLAARRGGKPAPGESRGVEELMSRLRPRDAYEEWCAQVADAGDESLGSPLLAVVRALLVGQDVPRDVWDVRPFLVRRRLLREDGSVTPAGRDFASQHDAWDIRDLTARWFRDVLECESVNLEAAVAGLLASADGAEVRTGDLRCLARAQHAADEFGRAYSLWDLEDELDYLFGGFSVAGVECDGADISVPAELGPAVALFARRIADEGLVRRSVVAGWRTLLTDPEMLLTTGTRRRAEPAATSRISVSTWMPS